MTKTLSKSQEEALKWAKGGWWLHKFGGNVKANGETVCSLVSAKALVKQGMLFEIDPFHFVYQTTLANLEIGNHFLTIPDKCPFFLKDEEDTPSPIRLTDHQPVTLLPTTPVIKVPKAYLADLFQ
jgi:hypothetical protein